MPRSRQPTSYPDELWDICEKVALGGEQFKIPVPHKRALSLRGLFHAFKSSIKREGEKIRLRQMRSAVDERILQLADVIDQVVCFINEDGLQFLHRSQSRYAVELRLAEKLPGAALAIDQKAADQLLEQMEKQEEIKPDVDPLKGRDYG
jgi:hypothetical protein